MSSTLSFEPQEWVRFSVPHSLRLIGEQQHLLGAGCVSVATTLRLQVDAEETGEEFSLVLGGGPRDDDGRLLRAEAPLAEFEALWGRAIQSLFAVGSALLEGLAIQVDFGPLWGICPPEVLATSPALAVAVAVAVRAHRWRDRELTELELAGLACRLHEAATHGGSGYVNLWHRFHGDALLSIVGGAGYVEPSGERLNVQQLLPPESLLLVMVPDAERGGMAEEHGEAVLHAVARAAEEGKDISQPGDAGFSALFALAGGALTEREVTMLYGLMRVRQMAEGILEYLGEPFVDNDRLAEICDEESAILADYFGFPASLYERVRATAGEAGALGAKLTWAFGSYPAAIVLAPGRRKQVGEALNNTFPGISCILADMDPAGLLPEADADALSAGF